MGVQLTQQLSFPLLSAQAVIAVAVADNVNAQIALTISNLGFYSNMTVTRVVASVESDVRGGANVTVSGLNQVVIIDFEAPLDVPVQYKIVLDNGNFTVTSNTVTIVTDGRTFWLKDVVLGAFSTKVQVESMADVVRPANVLGTFKVLGRKNPIMVTDVRQGRTGTMVLTAPSYAANKALTDIIASGNTLLFQAPGNATFPDMYFQVGDVSETWNGGQSSNPVHSFTIPFTETDPPSAEAFTLASNSWLLVTQFETWNDVLQHRLSWRDVLLTPFSDADRNDVDQSINDTFARTTTNSFGAADSGQIYSTFTEGSGTPANFSVGGGLGVLHLATVNEARQAYLGSLAAVDATVQFRTNAGVTPTGAPMEIAILGRYVDFDNHYRFIARIGTDNSVTARVGLNTGGVISVLTSQVTAITFTANTIMNIRVLMTGTTLQMKVWQSPSSEPTEWDATAVDGTFTTAAPVGLMARLSAGNSNTLPVLINLDNFVVADIS